MSRQKDRTVKFSHEMQAFVHRTDYDPERRVRTVYMPEGSNTDMSGAVKFFRRIDPAVQRVETIAGDTLDTVYTRRGEEWRAVILNPDGSTWLVGAWCSLEPRHSLGKATR